MFLFLKVRAVHALICIFRMLDACLVHFPLQGYRYAGLQLQDQVANHVVNRVVLCSCGNSFGRYGPSHRCTEPCPRTTKLAAEAAVDVERRTVIIGRVGADLQTDICGNILTNIVIYVFTGEIEPIKFEKCLSGCRLCTREWP
jgi:hypothetical protein